MKAAAKKDEEASKAKVVIPAGQKAASTFGLWAGMDKLVAMAEGAPQTAVDISKPLLLQCNAVKHAELENCQPIRSACFQDFFAAVPHPNGVPEVGKSSESLPA